MPAPIEVNNSDFGSHDGSHDSLQRGGIVITGNSAYINAGSVPVVGLVGRITYDNVASVWQHFDRANSRLVKRVVFASHHGRVTITIASWP